MAELYLVRHGQASFGAANYDKLSPLGHQQSQWLGEYFQQRDIQFEVALAGDLVRHRETLEGIQSKLPPQTTVETHAGLNEFAFQTLIRAYVAQHPDQAPSETPSKPELYRLLKKAMHCWMSNELEGDLPETWQHFEQRVADALKHIQHQFYGKKVLVVSSGGAIAMAIRQVLQAPKEMVVELNLQQRNSGFAHFFFNQNKYTLSGFNFVPHLDVPERIEHITYS